MDKDTVSAVIVLMACIALFGPAIVFGMIVPVIEALKGTKNETDSEKKNQSE